MNPFVLDLEHHLPAAPDRVWWAWTTVDGLRSWWWPGWAPTIRIDLRPGGDYRIEAADQQIAVFGRYLEIAPPTRLRFSWNWVDGVGGPEETVDPEELVDVAFAADGDGTTIRLRHSGPWTTAEPVENYRQGWLTVLGTLSDVSAEPRTAADPRR